LTVQNRKNKSIESIWILQGDSFIEKKPRTIIFFKKVLTNGYVYGRICPVPKTVGFATSDTMVKTADRGAMKICIVQALCLVDIFIHAPHIGA
jgi:hypothetical protein